MSQPGASAWTVLGCRLRWDLPRTGAALAAGTIDLPRARIIAEATVFLTAQDAARVEQRVLPAAAGQTTGQLRAAARRAVLAIDPEGAEQRRRDTERNARICLYPGEEGTATLTGSCLPGLETAAAMARITAMARALKSSGAHGGLDLLRAHVYLGLLLGTLPLIPPPPGAPPDSPPRPDDGPGDGPTGAAARAATSFPGSSPAPEDSSGPCPQRLHHGRSRAQRQSRARRQQRPCPRQRRHHGRSRAQRPASGDGGSRTRPERPGKRRCEPAR